MSGKRTISQKVKKLMEEDLAEVLRTVVEKPFWPPGISIDEGYVRLGDDTDGQISIVFSSDADAWITVWSELQKEEMVFGHRFRTYFGGGESLRTRNALLMLALAIKLDNEERPQTARRERRANATAKKKE